MLSDFHNYFTYIRHTKEIATNILDILTTFLYPQTCILCGIHGHSLCPECIIKLRRSPQECISCRNPSQNYVTHRGCTNTTHIQQGIVCWTYTKSAKMITHELKTALNYRIVKDLAPSAAKIIRDHIPSNSILVPIPTSPSRMRMRGIDHTKLIAKALSRELRIPVLRLIGRKETKDHQTGKDRIHRLGLSASDFQYISPRTTSDTWTVTLVDDICTTGATLNACATLVYKQGFRKITALTLFRGSNRRKLRNDCYAI